MGDRLTRNLVSQSLLQAVAAKRPAGGLIHHSDCGSQYCASEYQQILGHFKLKASMSSFSSSRLNAFSMNSVSRGW
jgi:putative transposase